MSTIRVDNFGPSAGGTTYSARGIGKAWVTYNQVTPAVEDSENVSSVTDISGGHYEVFLTNNMSNANYAQGNMYLAVANGALDRGVQRETGTATSSGAQYFSSIGTSGAFDAITSVSFIGDLV